MALLRTRQWPTVRERSTHFCVVFSLPCGSGLLAERGCDYVIGVQLTVVEVDNLTGGVSWLLHVKPPTNPPARGLCVTDT
jgi:hypothetical protein